MKQTLDIDLAPEIITMDHVTYYELIVLLPFIRIIKQSEYISPCINTFSLVLSSSKYGAEKLNESHKQSFSRYTFLKTTTQAMPLSLKPLNTAVTFRRKELD